MRKNWRCSNEADIPRHSLSHSQPLPTSHLDVDNDNAHDIRGCTNCKGGTKNDWKEKRGLVVIPFFPSFLNIHPSHSLKRRMFLKTISGHFTCVINTGKVPVENICAKRPPKFSLALATSTSNTENVNSVVSSESLIRDLVKYNQSKCKEFVPARGFAFSKSLHLGPGDTEVRSCWFALHLDRFYIYVSLYLKKLYYTTEGNPYDNRSITFWPTVLRLSSACSGVMLNLRTD